MVDWKVGHSAAQKEQKRAVCLGEWTVAQSVHRMVGSLV